MPRLPTSKSFGHIADQITMAPAVPLVIIPSQPVTLRSQWMQNVGKGGNGKCGKGINGKGGNGKGGNGLNSRGGYGKGIRGQRLPADLAEVDPEAAAADDDPTMMMNSIVSVLITALEALLRIQDSLQDGHRRDYHHRDVTITNLRNMDFHICAAIRWLYDDPADVPTIAQRE